MSEIPDSSWRDSAACRHDPELFFRPRGYTEALHMCVSHCLVAEDCLNDARARHTTSCVQGGLVWSRGGNPVRERWKPAPRCGLCAVEQQKE